ncbi:uncharacterized protein LOC121387752 isoform X2 [Gigantopelta aegis]|uniref:uncharacterized protein LOC121387752 isoform X2 n=1 Tax=Gigantopelta aegis TaxID=1735272 RepID=UPI001B888CD8|nr:uncharacterized protein LOC121387752 isoform X2 [Gigantopelta aegis]
MAIKKGRVRRYVIYFLSFIYFSLWGFALFNYRSHCVFTIPNMLMQLPQIDNSNAGKCQVDWDALDIAPRNPHVQKGRRWKPKNCLSWQKVAIVIPYRDRMHHLKILLNRIHHMLHRQLIDYRIFVIEQVRFATHDLILLPVCTVAHWFLMALEEEGNVYLTTHSTHFIYGYIASDIWLRTTQILREYVAELEKHVPEGLVEWNSVQHLCRQ